MVNGHDARSTEESQADAVLAGLLFNDLPDRRVLRSSFADEQSGGGTTDMRRPIRPDSEDFTCAST